MLGPKPDTISSTVPVTIDCDLICVAANPITQDQANATTKNAAMVALDCAACSSPDSLLSPSGNWSCDGVRILIVLTTLAASLDPGKKKQS